ncbi:AAA family ATPase [Rhodococcus qingshengii]|uniref:AAA family ATPase n=1 Tax=Rhodococcus qingshengii TaxID=334542 RepID=UPI0036D99FE5
MSALLKTVFINGTVGVGKSTVAQAISGCNVRAERPHAVIDLDYIRSCWPAPENDPFNFTLELENLNSLAENYRRAGIEHLIVVGVAETAEAVEKYRDATQSPDLMMCRLTAKPEIVAARLRDRHRDDPTELGWHLARAVELTSILDAAEVDDVVLDTTEVEPHDVACSVMSATGW